MLLLAEMESRGFAMQADPNRRFYDSRAMAAHYAKAAALHPDEAAVLHRHERRIAGRRILDLGVGGGRTSATLLKLSWDYVGVDYSRGMIERCRRRFPGVRFRLCDARDLSAFSPGSFDVVLFSNNGIDAVSHDDRLKIMSEVHRVLDASGLFVFSSHNRDFPTPKPWSLEHFAIGPTRDPIRFAKRGAAVLIGLFNYLRRAAHGKSEDEYSIIVDSAHRYALVHYTIRLGDQVAQLERAGFHLIEAVGQDGRSIADKDSEIVEDPWFHYVCRKSP